MDLTTKSITGIIIALLATVFGGLLITGVFVFVSDSSVKNDINAFYDAESLYYSANQAYANDTTLQAASLSKVQLSAGNTVKVNSAAAGFCIAGKSSTIATQVWYRVSGTSAIVSTAPASTALPTGVTCPTP